MNDPKDKLMDALLKEHASGKEQREQAIAAIEEAIDADVQENEVPEKSRLLYKASAAILFLSVAGIAGLAIYQKMQPDASVIAVHELSDEEQAAVNTVEPFAMRNAPAAELEQESLEAGEEAVSQESKYVLGFDVLGFAATEESNEDVGRESAISRSEALDQTLRGDPGHDAPKFTATAPKSESEPAPAATRAMAEIMDSVALLPDSLPGSADSRFRGAGNAAGARQADAMVFKGDLRNSGVAGGGGGVKDTMVERDDSLQLTSRDFDRERYGQLIDQKWTSAMKNPLSTFSIDVDTASYTNLRRILLEGGRVQPDAVRIEEMINYFDYDYPQPEDGQPFAVQTDLMECPWNANHHLVRIGLQGKEMPKAERPVSNLVFLIDVSGSMAMANKLPLLRQSLMTLLEELDERDKVSIVVYAGAEGLALPPTQINEKGREKVRLALDELNAGGSTNGGAGIKLAYKIAKEQFVEDGVNRVILASDGDFNVGVTGNGELVELVKENAKSKVFLSVLGFGGGNLNDAMMESITNDGNGNYYYIDSEREGRKVFLQNLTGTLVTIAKDVKIQVDFNPGKVQAYRLIGYANRRLRDEDFNDDKVDAGDIGAGHTVTALYEVVPHGVAMPDVGQVTPSEFVRSGEATTQSTPDDKLLNNSPNWLIVRLRHKKPDGDKSELQKFPLSGDPVELSEASGDFKFAAGVALFGMKLRDSKYIGDADWSLVDRLTEEGMGSDPHGYRAELRKLVEIAGKQED